MERLKQPFVITMRRYEIIGGIVWFFAYAFLMGFVVGAIMGLLNLPYSDATLNCIYFFLNFIITALLFRRFLSYSLPLVADHLLRFLKSVLIGFMVYWVLMVCFSALVELLGISTWVPNDDTISSIAGENYRIMWVGAVLLAPMTEETLIRGLIFGNIRRKNRILAYILTAVIFALMHMAAYLGEMNIYNVVYNLFAYGLPSVALCLCYEYAGTIWGPIALHMVVNAMGMSGY